MIHEGHGRSNFPFCFANKGCQVQNWGPSCAQGQSKVGEGHACLGASKQCGKCITFVLQCVNRHQSLFMKVDFESYWGGIIFQNLLDLCGLGLTRGRTMILSSAYWITGYCASPFGGMGCWMVWSSRASLRADWSRSAANTNIRGDSGLPYQTRHLQRNCRPETPLRRIEDFPDENTLSIQVNNWGGKPIFS